MLRLVVLLPLLVSVGCGAEGRNIVTGDSSLPPVPQDVAELTPAVDVAVPEETLMEETSPDVVDAAPETADVPFVPEVDEVEEMAPDAPDVAIDVEPPECVADSDCDDGDACTTDSCKVGMCFNIKASNECCVKDSDCENDDACTVGLCAGGECEQMEVDGCCHFDSDCADGLDSTFNLCKKGVCVYSLSPAPAACAGDGECDDGNECTEATCLAGFCSASIVDSPPCCDTPLDCDDQAPCTDDLCTDQHCSNPPATGPVAHASFTFDDAALPGFVIEDDGSSVKWQVSSKSFISAPYSLYFGDPATESINNGKKVMGSVTAPPVTLGPEGPFVLKAWTYVNVEPMFSVDQVFIYVDDGESTTEVWSKVDVGGSTVWQFVPIEVDLSDFGDFAGKTISLIFLFDSYDQKNNDYEGVYFDDVELLWPCP